VAPSLPEDRHALLVLFPNQTGILDPDEFTSGSVQIKRAGKKHSFLNFFMFIRVDVHNRKYIPHLKN
jgi:hypothetical protein